MPKTIKANAPPKHAPLAVIQRAKSVGIRDVIVGFSGGKDAWATLDLCVKHFERVEAYHMHIVRGLSWEEKMLTMAERKFGITIHRIPSPFLSRMMREASFRHATKQSQKCPLLKPADIDAYLRKITGIQWIAKGERASDSLERNAYIQETGGIDRLADEWQIERDAKFVRDHGREKKTKRSRDILYPVGFWREQDVLAYLKNHNLPIPIDFTFKDDAFFKQRGEKKRDFGGFQMDTVAFIKERMPEDYRKMLKVFPMLEAQCVRWATFKRLHDEGME